MHATSSLFFHFPLTIFNLNSFIQATWLREGAGGKPARAAAAGDAAAKKRACKLFLPPCVPTAADRGLGTEDRPRASARGHALIKIKIYYLIYLKREDNYFFFKILIIREIAMTVTVIITVSMIMRASVFIFLFFLFLGGNIDQNGNAYE